MKRGAAIILASLAVAMPRPAFAYRPFDSTDAAVAAPGELELELGPVGFLKTGPDRFLVAPGMTLNFGIAQNWEMVLQGRHLFLLDELAGKARFRVIDTGLFIKGVVREGSIQQGRGPSVAIELGPLLPTIHGESGASGASGVGATAAMIVSQRWTPVTLHLNGACSRTRGGNLDLFGGIIVEGPHQWPVRPVVEAFVERELNAAFMVSGLAGAIWQAKTGLSFDVGVRAARIDKNSAFELRAGLTCATSLWGT
jgi:hypothetical protein